jgi:hypothetical protein
MDQLGFAAKVMILGRCTIQCVGLAVLDVVVSFSAR